MGAGQAVTDVSEPPGPTQPCDRTSTSTLKESSQAVPDRVHIAHEPSQMTREQERDAPSELTRREANEVFSSQQTALSEDVFPFANDSSAQTES